MTTAVKFLVFGFLMFLGLCITVNDKPVFTHIYNVISPATKGAQRGVEKLFSASYTEAEKFSKKLFSNSVPKVKDSVKSGLSSPQRSKGAPLETIDREDKEQLDELIKSHN